MAIELTTLSDIRSSAITRVKGDPNDQPTIDFFNEAINTRYRVICSRKKWKFLRVTNRSRRLNNRYTTGTISVTNGQRIVTGVGTTWTSNHRRWWLKPNSTDNSYRVIAVNSTTSLTIASPLVEDTITTGGYQLYQSELGLFPDLEDVDDVRIDGLPWRIEPRGPADLNNLRQRYPNQNGAPKVYTIEGESLFEGTIVQDYIVGYDFVGEGFTKSIHFWPQIPDDDYTVQIIYKRMVDRLQSDTDEPLIPIEHRHVLLFFALSDWYFRDRQDQTGAYYEGLGKAELAEMENKYLDTDDILQFRPPNFRDYSHQYLLRHSQYYFDREG